MKYLLFTTLLLLGVSLQMNAQDLIAVSNGGTPEFFDDLQDALTSAQTGDTLWIPSGNFGSPGQSFTINREIHIIGTGSSLSAAASPSIISSNFWYGNFSDNSTFQGVHFAGSVTGSVNYADSDFLEFTRCYFTSVEIDENIFGNSQSNNWSFTECAIETIDLNNASNISFVNCIVDLTIDNGGTQVYTNSIVNHGDSVPGSGKNYTNSIVFFNGLPSDNDISSFDHCVFISNEDSIFSSSSFEDCHFLSSPDGLFVDQVDLTLTNASNDLNVLSSSVAHQAGNNGQDIGIYGGANAWKDGSLPINPAVIEFGVSGTSNPNGTLDVNIQVEAQDR